MNVAGGRVGRKAVDVEIPLVPFIDLLLCCVMFLLVTAVWNQLAGISPAASATAEDPSAVAEAEPRSVRVRLTEAGYTVVGPLGDALEIPRRGGALDREALTIALQLHQTEGRAASVMLVPDDGVTHAEVVGTLDGLAGDGFVGVSLSGI